MIMKMSEIQEMIYIGGIETADAMWYTSPETGADKTYIQRDGRRI